MRKIQDSIKKVDGQFEKKETWVLDTVGTNLIDILSLDYIDVNRTFSNNIIEIYKVLGIEAARQAIYNELADVIEFDGTYINYHHLSILCDRMTTNCKLVSIFRHGINNDDIGPIAKASFEETPEMFLRAAKHAELDLMTGVSSNIMCGQEGNYGTGSFQVLLNLNEIEKLKAKKMEKEVNISSLMMEDANNECSKNNLEINETTEFIDTTTTGDVDDDYNPGF